MPRTFHPVPGACKVEIIGSDLDDNRPIVNVLHVSCGTAPTLAQLTAIGNAFKTEFLANLNLFPDTYFMVEIVVTDLNASTGPQAIVIVSTQGTGGDALPGAAFKLDYATALRGRSFRGATYFPVPASQVTTATAEVNTTYIADWVVVMTAIEAALVALGGVFNLVVVSRKLSTWQVVTAIFGRGLMGYIRRRLFG